MINFLESQSGRISVLWQLDSRRFLELCMKLEKNKRLGFVKMIF